jgi:hypothetical protein
VHATTPNRSHVNPRGHGRHLTPSLAYPSCKNTSQVKHQAQHTQRQAYRAGVALASRVPTSIQTEVPSRTRTKPSPARRAHADSVRVRLARHQRGQPKPSAVRAGRAHPVRQPRRLVQVSARLAPREIQAHIVLEGLAPAHVLVPRAPASQGSARLALRIERAQPRAPLLDDLARGTPARIRARRANFLQHLVVPRDPIARRWRAPPMVHRALASARRALQVPHAPARPSDVLPARTATTAGPAHRIRRVSARLHLVLALPRAVGAGNARHSRKVQRPPIALLERARTARHTRPSHARKPSHTIPEHKQSAKQIKHNSNKHNNKLTTDSPRSPGSHSSQRYTQNSPPRQHCRTPCTHHCQPSPCRSQAHSSRTQASPPRSH